MGCDQSRWGVGICPVDSSPAMVLGSIPVNKDHIEGLGPVPFWGWDQSRSGVGIGTVGSNPTELLRSVQSH